MWKSWLDHSLKNVVSGNALSVNMWNCPKYFQNFHDSAFIMFFLILREADLQFFPLVLDEILMVFVNTLTADFKYPVQYCENRNFQFKWNYVENETGFLNFLFHFWNLHQVLIIFLTKDDRHSWCTSLITDCEKLG